MSEYVTKTDIIESMQKINKTIDVKKIPIDKLQSVIDFFEKNNFRVPDKYKNELLKRKNIL